MNRRFERDGGLFCCDRVMRVLQRFLPGGFCSDSSLAGPPAFVRQSSDQTKQQDSVFPHTCPFLKMVSLADEPE